MTNRLKTAISIVMTAALVLGAFPMVTLASSEPVITRQPANVAATVGQRVVLSVTAKAEGTLSYQWFRTADEVNRVSDDIQIIGNQARFMPAVNEGGELIPGATGRTFEPPIDESGVQSYYVEVSSSGAKTTSIAATVAVRPSNVANIVFVCGGNTCRSPMSKVITEDIFAKAGVPAVVTGVGSDIIPGDPASAHAVTLMAQRGMDLSSHVAQQWTPEILNEADIILTATGSHRNRINVPTLGIYSDKLFLFLEFIGGEGSVKDPFEQEMEVYIEVADIITDAAEKLLKQISNADRPVIRGVTRNFTSRMGVMPRISVSAVSPDRGQLSYQWFLSEDGKNSGGIVIPGATESTFYPSFEKAGTYRYYVEVTNTNANVKDGIKVDANGKPYSITAVTTSSVIVVTVEE